MKRIYRKSNQMPEQDNTAFCWGTMPFTYRLFRVYHNGIVASLIKSFLCSVCGLQVGLYHWTVKRTKGNSTP